MDTIVDRSGVAVLVHRGTAYGGSAQRREYNTPSTHVEAAQKRGPRGTRRYNAGTALATALMQTPLKEQAKFDPDLIQWVSCATPHVHRMYRAKLRAALLDGINVSSTNAALYKALEKYLGGEEHTICLTEVASGVVRGAKKTLGTFIRVALTSGKLIVLPVRFFYVFRSCVCNSRAS